VVNEGIQDICPPVMCDDHDLTVVLPAPAATFYQTMTAKLTFKYTWTSTLPTDLDIFAISPNAADHGPGSPDASSTGPGEEDLTVTDPLTGSGTFAPWLTGADPDLCSRNGYADDCNQARVADTSSSGSWRANLYQLSCSRRLHGNATPAQLHPARDGLNDCRGTARGSHPLGLTGTPAKLSLRQEIIRCA